MENRGKVKTRTYLKKMAESSHLTGGFPTIP